MKLLIVTQAIDRQHPILGFFHRWVEEFAKHCEQVHVICLEKGDFDLPANVQVHSLGKESKPASGIVYTWRLLQRAWQLRREYDAVFVHMIPEYVLAGAPVWLSLRKPVSLWYTHGTVSWALRAASLVVKNIFTADAEGMHLRSKKVVVTGHGIDLDQFKNLTTEKDLDLLTIGRLTRSKNLHTMLDYFKAVHDERPDTTLTIVGTTGSPDDEQYLAELQAQTKRLGLTEAVRFPGAITHADVPKWLSRAKVFVHTSTTGSLDKVLLEALAAGTPVVTTAPGASSLPLGEWQVTNAAGFTACVHATLASQPEKKLNELYETVSAEHSLQNLVPSLVDQLS